MGNKLTPVYVSPVASTIPFDNATNGFIADEAQSAIEEAKLSAQGFPRAGVRSAYNGTVTGNQWLGPNELLPNTPLIVFPLSVQLNEITWANPTANVQFRIQFRRNSRTGTIFHTLTVTSPNVGQGFQSGLAYNFVAGDSIHAQYLDDGQNASDLDLILWISRIV